MLYYYIIYYYNLKRTVMDVISCFNVYYEHIIFIFQVEGYIPPCSLVAIMGPRFVYKPKCFNKLYLNLTRINIISVALEKAL